MRNVNLKDGWINFKQNEEILIFLTISELAAELLRFRSSLEETCRISNDMVEDSNYEDRLVSVQSKDKYRPIDRSITNRQ